MKLRSLIYSGVVTATVAASSFAPVAFAQSGGTAGRNPFGQGGFAQTQNSAIQTRAGFTGQTSDLATIVGNIINIVLGFLGVLLLIYLVYAGFLWMTATDSKGPDKAKEMIKNSIIGLIIIVSSFAISNFVLNALGRVTSTTGT